MTRPEDGEGVDKSNDPWRRVAVALGQEKPPEGGDRPPRPPAGWGSVADALGDPETADRPDTDRPDTDGGPRPASYRRTPPPASGLDAVRRAWRWWGTKAAVATIVVVAVVAGVWVGVTSGGGLPANVALAFGDHQVTKAQVATNNNVLAQFYGIQAPAPSDQAAYATYLQTATKAYAIDLVLEDAARRMKVSIPASAVGAELDQLIKATAGGDTAKFDQALSSRHLTEADLRNQIHRQLLEIKLYNLIGGQLNVTPAQETQFYNANMPALATPETRAVSHILVADQATAQGIVDQLSHGANFAALASQDSLDTNSKGNGGALGTVARSQLNAAFADAAFTAAPNVPFGPINEGSGGGFDVGVVTAINPAQPATNDAKTQGIVKTYLTDQVQASRWSQWLSGQLARAQVRYAAGYRPAHPTAAPAAPAPTLAQVVLQQATSGSSAPAPPGQPGGHP